MLKLLPLSVGVVSAALLLSGCETPFDSAVAGAATGAVLGGALKGTGRDMARGAAIGAAGGYVLGKYGEAERARGYSQAQSVYAPPVQRPAYFAPPQTVYYNEYHPRGGRVPWGQFSGTPGYVYSPFGHWLVDVRGIPRGAEVVDPHTGRRFFNP